MAHGKLYKTFFALSWLADLILCILVAYVLIKAYYALNEPPFAVACAFGIFVILFILFTISFVIFLSTKRYLALIFTIVFLIGQFLCALITTITLFADDYYEPGVRFRDNPILWVENRRWLPILFSVVYLPFFLVQIFVINRYAYRMGYAGTPEEAKERKNTPYFNERLVVAT
uniref:Uncharacterized protein n=1 Tax=Acrobeloides nanus TaxID=290746 RepID=A0A914DXT0_9BILA